MILKTARGNGPDVNCCLLKKQCWGLLKDFLEGIPCCTTDRAGVWNVFRCQIAAELANIVGGIPPNLQVTVRRRIKGSKPAGGCPQLLEGMEQDGPVRFGMGDEFRVIIQVVPNFFLKNCFQVAFRPVNMTDEAVKQALSLDSLG